MTTPWGLPDFDAHEEIHFVTDEKCGLKAIIAVHSTHLGPAAGGARFWRYAADAEALTDAGKADRHQHAIWDEVRQLHLRTGSRSGTGAMADAYEDRLTSSYDGISKSEVGKLLDVPAERRFIGFEEAR